MSRNVIETVLGAVVLAVAGFFLVFAYTSADLGAVEGYPVRAAFSNTGGLQTGSDVRISGVKVGTVVGQRLDPDTYNAVVHMNIDPSIKLPLDTVAMIASESLLGGKIMVLEPGAEADFIEPGGEIVYTQAATNLEELLGKFIFSVQGGGATSGAAAGTPAN